jgi:hypothetical protein
MLTIGTVIASLLPGGSREGTRRPNWQRCPLWAPDAFAVVATLIDRSGCYTEPGLAISRNDAERKAKKARALANRKAGKAWSRSTTSTPPRAARQAWRELFNCWHDELCVGAGLGHAWKRAALDLLAIADEACFGVGFSADDDAGLRTFVAEQFVAQASGSSVLQLPESLTRLVPREVACVLPKSLTPEVGCNLRSLSHHLALLPGCGNVAPQWYFNVPPEREGSPGHALNLLLIPFPYVVLGTDFQVAREPEPEEPPEEEKIDGYFKLSQGWLEEGEKPLRRSSLASFVTELIRVAEQETGTINGIVFPETALTPEYLLDLADDLGAIFSDLEMLVAGTLHRSEDGIRNEAAIIHLNAGVRTAHFVQSKHHRWRLEASQIARYHLGHVLDPRYAWWEQVDVHDRRIMFGLSRHQAVIAALVCEDLARYDPVIPVLNAVGPNLVFALLMDGPQFKGRWSGRYATVLAEDPGSAVLTLTCLGMVRRWGLPGETTPQVIGVWKSRRDEAIELILPPGDHALVMSLGMQESKQRTLDLRQGWEAGCAVEYSLAGLRAVRHSNPPDWLERRVKTA